jgi:O-antigen/teichoic acid export membrane protein
MLIDKLNLGTIVQFWKNLMGPGDGAALARGSVGSLLTKIAGMGVMFGVHVLLARLLGTSEYGVYVYALTCVDMLAVMCLLGYHISLVRFVAEYRARNQWGLLLGIQRRSTQIVAGVSVLVSLVAGVLIWRFEGRLSDSQFETFWVGIGVLPIFCLCWLRESSLRALKRMVQSQILLRVLRPTVVGVLAISVYMGAEQIKSSWAMGCNLAAVGFAFLVGTVLLRRALQPEFHREKPVYRTMSWMKVSLPMLLLSSMHWILKRTDIIMIGAYLGTTETGIYSAASQVSGMVVLGLTSVNSMLGPMISEFYYTDKTEQLRRVVALAARAVFILMVAATIVMSLGGKIMLSLYGTEFVAAFVPLLILLGGQVVNAMVGPVGLIMTMTGHQNQAGLIFGFGAVVNVALNMLLIPRFGFVGAAVASATSMVLWNVMMFGYVWSVVGINSTIIRRHLKPNLKQS